MGGSSQFGLSVEQALAVAAQAVESSRVEFLGVHAYFGAQRLKLEPLVRTLRIAGDIVDEFACNALKPGVVDVGLGIGVPYLCDDEDLDHRTLRASLHEEWGREDPARRRSGRALR